MNRRNIWLHLGLAIVFVSIAAIAGRIANLDPTVDRSVNVEIPLAEKPRSVSRTDAQSEPEILVKLKPGISRDQISSVAARLNDRIEDRLEFVDGLYSIDDLDNAGAASVARQYAGMTDFVEYAEPNYRIDLDQEIGVDENGGSFLPTTDVETLDAAAPNDPLFAEQWALNNSGQNGGKLKADIGALKAWLKTKGSEEVVVAVLDSGVDYTHPDLVTNIWFRPDNVAAYSDEDLGIIDDKNGFNSADNNGDPMDDNGHGTHCAGIIGAEGNNGQGIAGINWKVEIMPLKFLSKGGSGTTKNAIEAINYAVDRKKAGVNVRVINASWGSALYSKALEDAIRAAGKEGILFVAAAGNYSTDNDRRPYYPSNYKLPNVISVAALDRNDALASFSNYGAKTVHIAAPGKEIRSTWLNDQYRDASGTSMAAPQVSGVAALLVADSPEISVSALRKKLLSSVDVLDILKGKVENGGRLNASRAFE